jgi:hypothetical protein
MQSTTVPAGDRNPNGHTSAEVLAALRGIAGVRRLSFRYELLDADGVTIEPALSNMTGGEVSMNWLADIKRTARFSMRETGTINFLADRIRPHVRVHLAPWLADDFVEFPQGVFLLATPKRAIDRYGRITREVEAYDQLQVYSDDLVADRYTVVATTNVVTAVTTLLGGIPASVAPSTAMLAVDKEWEPGTSKLRIINDLLDSINYNSLAFDENGLAIVSAYQAPSLRAQEYEYATDHLGVMLPDAEQELDLFGIPNKWVLVVSEPDVAPIVSTYTNNDPSSPTSTVRRDRTIVDYRLEQDAVDQATLDAKAQRLAFEASQVYEAIDFKTGVMPIHSGNDVYRIRWDALAVNHTYAEQTWSMPLRAGAEMTHRARRVVTI